MYPFYQLMQNIVKVKQKVSSLLVVILAMVSRLWSFKCQLWYRLQFGKFQLWCRQIWCKISKILFLININNSHWTGSQCIRVSNSILWRCSLRRICDRVCTAHYLAHDELLVFKQKQISESWSSLISSQLQCVICIIYCYHRSIVLLNQVSFSYFYFKSR